MKRALYTLLTVFSLTLLAGCKKNKDGDTAEFTPSLDPNTSCAIKVVGDYDSFPELINRFKEFKKNYYNNVELTYTKISGEYKEMIATVLEGNDKPNIFFASTWMLEQDKYASVVNHMENLSDPALKMNLSCIREGLINKDNTKMVPLFGRSYGMLVNNDLFARHNLAVPTTWDGLLSACQTFKSAGIVSPMMGYSQKAANSLMNTIAYPAAVAAIANDSALIAKANEDDASIGEYMRAAFNAVNQLATNGYFDLTECNKIADNYNLVLMRFLEGDVPMMICADDTPSGTKKREERSEAFIAHPFSYSYAPIPLTNNGGYFIDNPSKLLSVNKDCDNLDMTNEFMRFLISNTELNEMAKEKNLVSATKQISFDSIYAPFGNVSADHTFSPEGLGIQNPIKNQIREASYKVGTGELTVQQAIDQYGTFGK